MVKLTRIVAILIILSATAWADGFVVVCPISDMVDDGLSVLVKRAVEESKGAQALIFEVDTPGGLVDAAIRITKSIGEADCPTIAYIKGMGAISAGALISFSCQHIIMENDTNIGAATPVIASPEGNLPTGEKEVSYMRAKMRSLAERNNHNPALAEAMVDKDIELWTYPDAEGKLKVVAVYTQGSPAKAQEPQQKRPGILSPTEKPKDAEEKSTEPAQPEVQRSDLPENAQLILPAGKLLTLTPQEAIKYGLIPQTVMNLDEVLDVYGYTGAEVRRIEMTTAERVYRFLTNPMVAGILLLIGIGGIYLEIKTPGFGLPGIIGITCLALFFGAHIIIGIADWLDVLLVVIGIALIITELFFIPGFGLIGVAGIILVLVGLYLALTGVPIPEYSWEYDRLMDASKSLGIALAAFAGLIVVLWKIFPHTPMYGSLVLTSQQKPELGYSVQSASEQTASVGLKGVAVSMLRPVGRARFGDVSYQVVTRGDFIPAGSPIMIVQVDGNRYVVEKIEEEA